MIVRLLIYAALVWLLIRLVKGLLGGGDRRARTPPPESGTRLRGGDLVQDPQCGVYVPKETALRDPEGRYFCSPECRDRHRARGG